MAETSNIPLAGVFRFTLQDLRINRQGKLSATQVSRLWGRFLLTFLGGLLLVVTPILVTGGMVAWAADLAFTEALNDQRALLGYIIAAILGVMYSVANWKALILVVDLLLGRVTSFKATAQIFGQYVGFGKYRFLVEEQALTHLQTGVTYRVFWLARSQTLLSIEYAE